MNGLLDVAQDYGLEITELLSGTSMIIHGTTVATNTLVERKGAKVGLITTGGFRGPAGDAGGDEGGPV